MRYLFTEVLDGRNVATADGVQRALGRPATRLPRVRGARGDGGSMGVGEDDVFAFGLSLPRATEGTVRGRRKLYVGRIVFAAMDHDGILGVGFPREWREAAVNSDPEKFLMPTGGDLRYRWIYVRMDAHRRPRDGGPRARRVGDVRA